MTAGPVGNLQGPRSDSPAAAPTLESAATELPWRRLAPGMLLVEPVREIIRFIPMLIALVFAGRAGESGPPWGLIGTAAVIALGISRYATTRYRVTPSVVEVRRGVFQRKHLTVPRDRIRTVDVSAHPLQRLLRLVKVQIGTGTSHVGSEAMVLDGLPASTASALRAELLHRAAMVPAHIGLFHKVPSIPTATNPTPAASPPNEALPNEALPNDGLPNETLHDETLPDETLDDESLPNESLLARLNPRWIGYAPATLSGVVTGAVLIGLGWRIVNEARLDPKQISAVHQTLRYLQSTPLWLDVLQISLVVMVAVTLLSVAGYVLSFWGYSLTRHVRGTVQVSRGLLTTRATSIEERRLHGVDRSDPLLLRWVGGARLQAIATGLRHRGSERGSALLVPPAPLSMVIAVEGALLRNSDTGRVTLTAHGPAARRRRFSRTLGLAAVLVVALLALSVRTDWLIVPAAVSVTTLPLAALLARDRYRNLGHRVLDDRLIIQTGSLSRHRRVLAVSGVIGVTMRQSFFQRRSGLRSLTATTAAGAQRYDVPDLTNQNAMDLAARLLPECATFIESA